MFKFFFFSIKNDERKIQKNYDAMILKLTSSFQFQRLGGKTQLFANESKDNYCNRLTHTLEVASISNCLSDVAFKFNKKAKINKEKLLLIALAYDIGHTPFGHVGERALHNILSGNDDLGGLLCLPRKYGFKHNINSVKVFLEILDSKNPKTINGDVLFGIICHSKLSFSAISFNGKPVVLDYGIGDILKNTALGNKITAISNGTKRWSVEDEIVALSDSIAQRLSDLSDSLTAKTILKDDVLRLCQNNRLFKEKNHKNISIPQMLFGIKDSLIKEAVFGVPFCNLKKKNNVKKTNFKETVEKPNFLNLDLKKFIEEKSTSCYLVRTNDAKYTHIIRQLFKVYFNTPIQLEDDFLISLKRNLVYLNGLAPKTRFFPNGKPNMTNWSNQELCIFLKTICFVVNQYESNRKIGISTNNYRLIDGTSTSISNNEIKIYEEAQFEFIKMICKSISLMTDKYAIQKYNAFYNGTEG